MADTNVTVTPTAVAEAVEAVAQPDKVVETKPVEDPRLASFARRERQLRRIQQDLAAEKKALSEKVAQYETGYIPKDRIKNDFWGVASEMGIDYNTITEQVLNQPNMNDPATRALMGKLKQLEDKQNAAERQAQENTQRQYDQALKQIGSEVKMMVDANPDYETIKETGMQQAVVELIERTFTEGRPEKGIEPGTLMNIEDAAAEVEQYLLKEATKMSQLKKLQKLKSEQQTQAPEKQSQTPGIKTLTNAVHTSAPRQRSTEKERIARAMAAFSAGKR